MFVLNRDHRLAKNPKPKQEKYFLRTSQILAKRLDFLLHSKIFNSRCNSLYVISEQLSHNFSTLTPFICIYRAELHNHYHNSLTSFLITFSFWIVMFTIACIETNIYILFNYVFIKIVVRTPRMFCFYYFCHGSYNS